MEISQKQLDAFLKSESMRLDGIGFNDNWNMQKFGITLHQSGLIRKAMVDEYGLKTFWPKKPNLDNLNKRLK